MAASEKLTADLQKMHLYLFFAYLCKKKIIQL